MAGNLTTEPRGSKRRETWAALCELAHSGQSEALARCLEAAHEIRGGLLLAEALGDGQPEESGPGPFA